MSAIEKCAGCGIASIGGHPMVGVMAVADAEALGADVSEPSARGFVSVPVCGPCHADPAHRVYPLKCAFFPRSAADTAVRMAGTNQIGL